MNAAFGDGSVRSNGFKDKSRHHRHHRRSPSMRHDRLNKHHSHHTNRFYSQEIKKSNSHHLVDLDGRPALINKNYKEEFLPFDTEFKF